MKAEFWPKKTPLIEFNVCWNWDNVELRLITTSAFAEVRFRHDGPCVSSLGLPTGKRNSSAGEHIHIFPRMLVFVSGAEKSHIMPINSSLVQMSHSELPTSTRRCFAYQFRLPSMKTYYDVTRERLYIHKPWVALSCLCENENLHQKVMEGQDVELVWCNFNPRAIWILPKCRKFKLSIRTRT